MAAAPDPSIPPGEARDRGASRYPAHGERLVEAAGRLAGVTDTPRLDAEILLAHVLNVSRTKLLACLRDRGSAPGFDALIERRLAREPIAYILGEWEFFSLRFKVVPPLLVPRPETEHLVEAVLAFAGDGRAWILDVGAGTGCVAVALAKNIRDCRVIATDVAPRALDVAAENVARHGVTDRVAFRCGDLFDALYPGDGPFDVICSNPPYVEEDAWPALPPVIRLHESPQALLAGKDGLAVIRRLAAGAQPFLNPGGLLAFEVGAGQREAVGDLLGREGYRDISFRRDLAGIDRIALAHRPD
jgi:release factor glutamine methyltransferase